MKTLKKLFVLISIAISAAAFAQTPVTPTPAPSPGGGGGGGSTAGPTPVLPAFLPTELPNSVDDFVILAELSVRRGYIGIGIPAGINDVDTLTYKEVAGSNYSDVAAKLTAAKLRFKPLSPKSWLSAWVGLQNAEGFTVLQASSSFKLELRDGKYVVPEVARHLDTYLNGGAFQHFPGVERIDFAEENSQGEVVFQHTIYPINLGQKGREDSPSDLFFVPAYFAQNKIGSTVLYVRAGSEGGQRGFAYDLRSGQYNATPVQDTGFAVGTRDVYRFTDAANVVVHATNNRRPILHLTYTRRMEVRVTVSGTWNDVTETPNGMGYRARFPNGEEESGFTDSIGNVNAFPNGINVLDPGEYYIRFTFPTYGSDSDRQFGRPYDGNDGGRG